MSKLKRVLLSSLKIISVIIVIGIIAISFTIGSVVGFIFNSIKNGFEFAMEDFDDIFKKWLEK